MEDVGDLVDFALEDADRGRIGEHQRGDVFVDHALEFGEIDHAQRVGLEVRNLVSAGCRRRGIRPVRGVGNNDLLARVALGLVIGAGEQNPGELALRPGRWLQCNRVHAGDLDQAVRQQLHDPQRALRERFGLVRMRLCQALKSCHRLIDAGVVLHRARAQRIHPQIDRIVPRRQASEVADDLNLAQLGHGAKIVGANHITQQRRRIDGRNVELREAIALLARGRFLKDQVFVLIDVRGRLARRSDELCLCHKCSSKTLLRPAHRRWPSSSQPPAHPILLRAG